MRRRRHYQTKAATCRWHLRNRAGERYGIVLTREVQDRIAAMIQFGEDCIFVDRQSNRISRFAVRVGGQVLPVVYDNRRHLVVTALPPEVLEEWAAANPEVAALVAACGRGTDAPSRDPGI